MGLFLRKEGMFKQGQVPQGSFFPKLIHSFPPGDLRMETAEDGKKYPGISLRADWRSGVR